jgi:hypothetical protein
MYIMAQIESTPFLLNTRYGFYDRQNKIIPGKYFKILEVTKDETEENLFTESGKIRTIEVTIEYKKVTDIEPMVIHRASITKKSEDDEYTLFFNGGHDGILIPNVVVSTEPLPNQGGGYRNRKSTKKVRRRRRNKTTGRRSTY